MRNFLFQIKVSMEERFANASGCEPGKRGLSSAQQWLVPDHLDAQGEGLVLGTCSGDMEGEWPLRHCSAGGL